MVSRCTHHNEYRIIRHKTIAERIIGSYQNTIFESNTIRREE